MALWIVTDPLLELHINMFACKCITVGSQSQTLLSEKYYILLRYAKNKAIFCVNANDHNWRFQKPISL